MRWMNIYKMVMHEIWIWDELYIEWLTVLIMDPHIDKTFNIIRGNFYVSTMI